MELLKGKGVSAGIAMGTIYLYKKKENQIKRYKVTDTQSEVTRFEAAKNEAIKQLQTLYEKAVVEVGEANAMIFQIHQMMLEDLDYIEIDGLLYPNMETGTDSIANEIVCSELSYV